MNWDVSKLLVEQAAPCVDEDYAAKFHLEAHVRKERDHADTLFENTFLHIAANMTSIPATSYRYMRFLFEWNHRHTTLLT